MKHDGKWTRRPERVGRGSEGVGDEGGVERSPVKEEEGGILHEVSGNRQTGLTLSVETVTGFPRQDLAGTAVRWLQSAADCVVTEKNMCGIV
jgi:hypothetical protein